MSVVGKRLLILGAGRGQIGLYKAAKEMGIVTIAGTMSDNNPPGIILADEVVYMNITDPDLVLEKAKDLKLDGVTTSCLDKGLTALGKVCDKLGLVGFSENTAIMCNDKLKMKEAFMKHGVRTAQYAKVSDENELKTALEKIQLPVIIKATDLAGSRGIYISKTREAAFEGFREVMKLTKRNYCIIEEYIEGWEFGTQAFVYNGEVIFVMPHGDETYMSHTAVPVGHYVPLECNEDIYRQTEDIVKKAIKALDLNNCAVNVDLILCNNKVYMIELTGRVGANCLPELVEINYGIEYYKMIAAMAVGDNPLEYWKKRDPNPTAGLAKMIQSIDKAGIVRNVEYVGEVSKNIVEITFFKHPGDEVRIFESSADCIGQIIVKGENLDECRKEVDAILEAVEVTLI